MELACVAGKKLVGRYARLGWLDFRQKLGAALARRGFSYETVRSVTRQLWDECQTQTPARDQ
ncbi:MAG TPA: RecX family transcriptional regulator [Anaerolineaceae bacterium]|nr:RecX family transcriptional regulator [Anaerolineaceae bacterium]